jgi:hypothetical protein
MQADHSLKSANGVYWLILLSFFTSCTAAKKTQPATDSTAYVEIARQKLGENVKFDFNKDKTYMLCQAQPGSEPDNPSFSFFVYSMDEEKVVLEQQVRSGSVQWLSNLEIEVFTTPGFMRNDQSRDEFTQVYHVVTGKSTPKTEWGK